MAHKQPNLDQKATNRVAAYTDLYVANRGFLPRLTTNRFETHLGWAVWSPSNPPGDTIAYFTTAEAAQKAIVTAWQRHPEIYRRSL